MALLSTVAGLRRSPVYRRIGFEAKARYALTAFGVDIVGNGGQSLPDELTERGQHSADPATAVQLYGPGSTERLRWKLTTLRYRGRIENFRSVPSFYDSWPPGHDLPLWRGASVNAD
jgi:hypothetical protein